jgi:hypothetical protein
MEIRLVGSSHAENFGRALLQLPSGNIRITIDALRGATFDEIPFPDFERLGSNTVVFLFPFGNNLYEKGSHQITREHGKIIHLRFNRPTSEESLLRLCQRLEKKLEATSAKVFIIGSFYKYLFCCRRHKHTGIVRHQNRHNAIIYNYFRDKYEVIDHRQLVLGNRRKCRILDRYRSKQRDAVHFSSLEYRRMAQELLDKALQCFSQN